MSLMPVWLMITDVTGLALGAGLEMDVDAGLAVGPGVDGAV